MRLRLLPAAALLCLASAGAALANDADFKLVNRTGYQIDSVYAGPVSSRSWGRDIMGRDSLADGESVNINFPHGGGRCHYDLKVTYNDGDEAEWHDIDLCKWEEISLFWDGKQTRAVGK